MSPELPPELPADQQPNRMEYAHLSLQITGIINPESILRVRRASNRKSFVDKMYGINVRDRTNTVLRNDRRYLINNKSRYDGRGHKSVATRLSNSSPISRSASMTGITLCLMYRA